MPAGYKQPIMKTSVFLLLSLQIFCKMNMLANECYQFVDQQELLSMIRGDEGTLFTLKPQVLPGARIGVFFELPDGRVIVIYPINGPKQGLMLNGMDCLKDMIAKGRIPLEEPDPDFLTRSNHLITGPDNLFGHHSGYLAATWGEADAPFPDKAYFGYYYSKILSYYQLNGHFRDEDVIAYFVVAGEKIRRELNGRWLLVEARGVFNPYYELYILKNDKEYVEFCFEALHSLSNELPYDDYVYSQMFDFLITQKMRILKQLKTSYYVK